MKFQQGGRVDCILDHDRKASNCFSLKPPNPQNWFQFDGEGFVQFNLSVYPERTNNYGGDISQNTQTSLANANSQKSQLYLQPQTKGISKKIQDIAQSLQQSPVISQKTQNEQQRNTQSLVKSIKNGINSFVTISPISPISPILNLNDLSKNESKQDKKDKKDKILKLIILKTLTNQQIENKIPQKKKFLDQFNFEEIILDFEKFQGTGDDNKLNHQSPKQQTKVKDSSSSSNQNLQGFTQILLDKAAQAINFIKDKMPKSAQLYQNQLPAINEDTCEVYKTFQKGQYSHNGQIIKIPSKLSIKGTEKNLNKVLQMFESS